MGWRKDGATPSAPEPRVLALSPTLSFATKNCEATPLCKPSMICLHNNNVKYILITKMTRNPKNIGTQAHQTRPERSNTFRPVTHNQNPTRIQPVDFLVRLALRIFRPESVQPFSDQPNPPLFWSENRSPVFLSGTSLIGREAVHSR